MRNEGCWIFISHSSKDIEKIRMIRNEFEKYGQNPLAFHLKCLKTDTEENKNELLDLIKREIESREWFVFCESDSSLNSEYVKLEREYVISCQKKMIWHINLNSSDESILRQVREICEDLQIYISYSSNDSPFVSMLTKELEEKDYFVTTNRDISSYELPWAESVKNKITNVSKKGLFLFVLTENSIKSPFVQKEIIMAQKNEARIITLLIGDETQSSETFRKLYGLIDVYKIPHFPKEEHVKYIVELIDQSLQNKLNNSLRMVSDVIEIENKIQEIMNYHECYHTEEAIHIGHTGPDCDYCEIYKFPCCGKYVLRKDELQPSRYRADGCKKKKDDN